MPTLEEALIYLGYEADETDAVVITNVKRALATAVKTLKGAVGSDIETLMPDGDERATELVLIYLDDLHTNRGLSTKVSGATRRLVATMELQLRLDLRRLREGVQV